MKQMQATDSSALVSNLVAQAITVLVTGVKPVRRMFIRIIFLVATAVGAVSFAVGVMLRDYLPDNPVPSVQSTVADPASKLPPEQQPKPSPHKRSSNEDLRRLIKTNPL